MQYPPPVATPVIGSEDVWNYYFSFFVVPLWLGRFTMSLATSYSVCIYQPLASKLTIKNTLQLKVEIDKFSEKNSRQRIHGRIKATVSKQHASYYKPKKWNSSEKVS
jgi:hypothetical protein